MVSELKGSDTSGGQDGRPNLQCVSCVSCVLCVVCVCVEVFVDLRRLSLLLWNRSPESGLSSLCVSVLNHPNLH